MMQQVEHVRPLDAAVHEGDDQRCYTTVIQVLLHMHMSPVISTGRYVSVLLVRGGMCSEHVHPGTVA